MSKIEAIGGSKLEKLKSKTKDAELEEIKNEENEEDIDDESDMPIPSKEFDYLLSMSLWSLSQEKVDNLLKQKEEKNNEIKVLKSRKVEDIWINDIDEFIKCLDVINYFYSNYFLNRKLKKKKRRIEQIISKVEKEKIKIKQILIQNKKL
jgi:DNA topoisomerase-2